MIADRPYRLRLVGSFELSDPDGARVPVTSKKGMALLALLAMARGGERSRAWLQDRLWGSRPLEQAQASLRRELTNLRTAIGPNRAETLLQSDMVRVRLDLQQVVVDVRELEAGADADVLATGEFLEGFDIAEEGFEDWLREQRNLIEDLLEHARRRAWEETLKRGVHSTEAEPAAPGTLALTLASGEVPPVPHKPSLAVLSFWHPGSEDAAALSSGLAEGLAINLARSPILFVVHGGGAPLEGSREGDRARICRELGVRYLIEGSVQESARQFRVHIRLVDGLVGEQLWAERFTGDFQSLFAFQDEVANKVAPLIDASVDVAERRHAMAVPVQSANAYQLYWRANALFRRWEPEPLNQAIAIAQKILAMEPDNAWAAALGSFCHAITISFGWSEEPEASRAKARRLYEIAMRNGGDDPFVLGYAAGALLGIEGDLEVADALVERALSVHADMSATLFWGGWVDIARGVYDRSLDRFERALQVNPRSAVRPHSMTGIGICLFALGRPEDALTVLKSAAQQLPHYPVTLAALAAVLSRLGRFEEAGHYATKLQETGGSQLLQRLLGGAPPRLPHGDAKAQSASTLH